MGSDTNKDSVHPFDKLAARTKDAEQRISLRNNLSTEADGDTTLIIEAIVKEVNCDEDAAKAPARGSEQAKELLENDFYKGEQIGLFDAFPMKAGNEFPSLLTRLPIFMPVQRRAQKKFLDDNNALPFETPFGSGKRIGPNLTIADEDRLIALLRLRQKKLRGLPSKLPIPLPEVYRGATDDEEGRVNVHTLICTVTQINDELGLSDGGVNYKNTVASLQNLSELSLTLETKKHDRYFGKFKRGGNFKLVDIQWTTFTDYGIIVAQFSPLMVNWLEKELTYLNWDIRKKLKGDAAKAIHRFLSSQGDKNGYFERELLKIAESVGLADKSQKKIKQLFEDALQQMIELGWLTDAKISGTGRKIPFKLHITRNKRNRQIS